MNHLENDPIEISVGPTGIPDGFLGLKGKVLSQSDEAEAQAEEGRRKAAELTEQQIKAGLRSPEPAQPAPLPKEKVVYNR